MYSDLFELSSEQDISLFFTRPENREPVNTRIFQNSYFVDFESIDHFLDLEEEKPSYHNPFDRKSKENYSNSNVPIIDIEYNDNISNSGFQCLLEQTSRSSPPSPSPSSTTTASKSSRKSQTSHSMNNMPGFLISAMHSKVVLLKFKQIQILSLNNLNQVSNCFYRLIDVVRNIRTKVGSRKQLRMVFNQLDSNQVKNMHRRMNLVKAEEIYLDIVETYSNQVLNEAKTILRTLLAESMSQNWIHEYSLTRKFADEEKRETFEKYLAYFRRQLQEGNIRELVNRKEVLYMDPFQQGKEESAELFHLTSHTCDEGLKPFTNTELRRFQ